MIRCRRLLAGLLAAVLLSGCWGNRELNQLALVLAVAVDPGEELPLRATLAVARPSALPPVGGGGGGKEGQIIWLLSHEGETVMEAVRAAALELPRQLFWAHTKVILFGAELAGAGLESALDVFTRNREIRRHTFMVATRGPAAAVLAAGNPLEPVGPIGLAELQHNPITPQVRLRQFADDYAAGVGHPFLPLLTLGDSQRETAPPGGAVRWSVPRVEGVAVYQGGRAVWHLDAAQMRAMLWLRGEVASGGVLAVDCPGESGRRVTVEIARIQRRVTPRIAPGGELQIGLDLSLDGLVGEQQCRGRLVSESALQVLERVVSQDAHRRLMELVAAAQARRLDPFGFGAQVHRSFPTRFPRSLDRWEEAWARAEVEIRIQTAIPRAGLQSNSPLLPEEEMMP